MGNARYASGTSRHISCGNTEKYQYSELDDMDVGKKNSNGLVSGGSSGSWEPLDFTKSSKEPLNFSVASKKHQFLQQIL